MNQRAVVLGGALMLSLPAGITHAFSEPTLYSEPTVMGGGGGRFFTGSPLDSYSCAVCHQGGPKPSVTLRGFPESYQPGKTYEIELAWTAPQHPHALNVEIVDSEGRSAGTLALPDAEDIHEEGRCALAEDEAIRELQASYLVEAGPRNIVGVRSCGAQSLVFKFTAPNQPKVALTASVVRSDKSEDPSGDGVLEIRQISYRKGDPRTSAGDGGCTSGTPTPGSGPWAAFLTLCLRYFGSRTKRRSAR